MKAHFLKMCLDLEAFFLKNLEASQASLICFNINIRQNNYFVFCCPNLDVVYFVRK